MTKQIDIFGAQHSSMSVEMYDTYTKIFEAVKKEFPKTELSRFFPLQGNYYNEYTQLSRLDPEEGEDLSSEAAVKKYLEPAVRFMLVGRSVNGWEPLTEKSPEEFTDAAAETIHNAGFSWLQDNGLGTDTYIGADSKERRYSINRSAFFRCTKGIINRLKPISSVQSRWFEHIVWNNLYPIAPPDTGNAMGKLQDIQLEFCKELLLQQIEYYRPTHILFMTDWEGWFDRFADIFPDVEKVGNSIDDNVVACGKRGNVKVVVSIRPDRTRPNKPDENRFADDVVDCFKSI